MKITFIDIYGLLRYIVSGRRLAVLSHFAIAEISVKGGGAMTYLTHTELYALMLVIVAVVALFQSRS